MKTLYTNDFLNQYSNANMPNGILPGAGFGGAAGGGLGALFASLAGANPAIGALGAVPGALVGAGIGNNIAASQNARQRLAAFQQLSPADQDAAVNAFINDMNSSFEQQGIDGDFNEWYQRNPNGFKQFMLNNM